MGEKEDAISNRLRELACPFPEIVDDPIGVKNAAEAWVSISCEHIPLNYGWRWGGKDYHLCTLGTVHRLDGREWVEIFRW